MHTYLVWSALAVTISHLCLGHRHLAIDALAIAISHLCLGRRHSAICALAIAIWPSVPTSYRWRLRRSWLLRFNSSSIPRPSARWRLPCRQGSIDVRCHCACLVPSPRSHGSCVPICLCRSAVPPCGTCADSAAEMWHAVAFFIETLTQFSVL